MMNRVFRQIPRVAAVSFVAHAVMQREKCHLEAKVKAIETKALPPTFNDSKLYGFGHRKKFFINVYLAGLYLEDEAAEKLSMAIKSDQSLILSDALAVLTPDHSTSVLLSFCRAVGKDQFVEAIVTAFAGLEANDISLFKNYLQNVIGEAGFKTGDVMEITWLKGGGINVSLNFKEGLCFEPNSKVEQRLMQVYLDPQRTVSQELVQCVTITLAS